MAKVAPDMMGKTENSKKWSRDLQSLEGSIRRANREADTQVVISMAVAKRILNLVRGTIAVEKQIEAHADMSRGDCQ